MELGDKLYVCNADGKVYGPVALDVLRQWVHDGRVEPVARISCDLKEWIPAPNIPDLGMEWVVENNPGQFYGPVHRAVVDDFIQSGALVPDARFYRDMRRVLADKASLESAVAAAREQAAAELAAARELSAAELANVREQAATELAAARKHAAAAEAARDDLQRQLDDARAAQATLVAECEAVRRKLAETAAALAETREEVARLQPPSAPPEVLVPDVIIADAPPPKPSAGFANASGAAAASLNTLFGGKVTSLADLEREAQAELARMKAAGGKGFFGFGKHA